MELSAEEQRRRWSIKLIRELWRENQQLRRRMRGIPPQGQSRKGSLIEAGTNVLVGLAVSIAANMLVLPQFGYSPGLREATEIGVIFTGISLVRSYLLRRWFNWRHHAPSNGK